MSEEPVTICRGVAVCYQTRVRFYGHQRYSSVGKPSKSFDIALRRLSKAFIDDRHRLYKRGDVLMMADYYDPVQLCELVRR